MRCGANSAGACALAVMLAACGQREAPPPAAVAQAPPSGASTAPHGDHNPHHGGVVMMKGDDLHYEVVLDPSGLLHQLFFTDAVREDLPASVATDVSVTLKRPSGPEERIPLAIDDAGESWIGHGAAVSDPDHTSARVSFTIRGEPYWIDLPFRQAAANTSR